MSSSAEAGKKKQESETYFPSLICSCSLLRLEQLQSESHSTENEIVDLKILLPEPLAQDSALLVHAR